jgi:hypothetical protein
VPIILTLSGGVNDAGKDMVTLLEVNNILLAEANETSCDFLEDTIYSFLGLDAIVLNKVGHYHERTYLLWAQLLPVRCNFQSSDGVITQCTGDHYFNPHVCDVWNLAPEDPSDATPQYFAEKMGIRVGGITQYNPAFTTSSNFSIAPNTTFSVRALLNENHVIGHV